MVKTLKMIIRSNMVKNCNKTEYDVDLAQVIFGPDISYAKGKTTRRKPVAVINNTIQIPKEFKYKHHQIQLYMDTMYVNELGFLNTIGHPIFYREAVPIENNTHDKYYKQLDKILRVYHNSG